MMASLVINSIRSALNALESSEEDIDSDKRVGTKFLLKFLELFVLCARKLGNDALLRFHYGKVCTLASLFQRIHHALSRNPPPYNVKNIENLSRAIGNSISIEEMGGWYNTLLVSLPQRTSFNELNDIIDSVLEHLYGLLCVDIRYDQDSKQPIEALIAKITFLRNFIRFATLRSIEPPQFLDNLLTHIQAVAVDVAHTSFMYIFQDYDEEEEYYVKPNIPVLLQMIKMVDPQVDETYTQALTSAKLSTHLLSSVIMKDFIDSLLWNLWERLHLDTPIVISTNSELRLVYEFLRLLSNVLKEQPNKFDKRIGEFTRVVICDAGILIFSLYQRDMEKIVPASGLLQRINRITQIVKGKDFSIPDLLQRISRVTQIVKGQDFSIPDLLQMISMIGQGLSYINMMASFVLNSIRSALNTFESWEDYIEGDMECIISTKYKLKNLELFVLCARKLGNDAQLRFYDGEVTTLASLLQRILDAITRNPPLYNWEVLKKFEGTIAGLKKEIGGWYNTVLVSLPQPTSFDELNDIIDSLLDNLHLILRWRSTQPIEALIEKITFLRNFIRFATLGSIESPQMLAHIHAVAVDAAHTSFMFIFHHDYDVELNIPALLQMIKVVDPQVDETYSQALTSSKLSTHLLSRIPNKDPDPLFIMKDFIASLLWNLWERLHKDTPIVISINSALRLVYEGLRLLRSMLQKQPNKFDKRIGELTRVVICDAGILIFSLYQRDMEIVVPTSGLLQRINRITQIVNGKDFSILDLLQRISHIRQRVEGKDLSIPDLRQSIHHRAREQVGGNNLPKTNELGFIDLVLENLLGMTSSKECYDFQGQFRMIHDELSSVRYSLGKIERVRNEQKDLEAFWNDGVKVAYRVEFFIDDLMFGYFQGSSSTSFDSTVEDILREVKSVNSKIHHTPDIKLKELTTPDIKLKEVSMAPSPVLSQNRAPVADDIVGFHDDITSIIDRLKRGSRQLKVVAIVGMPGMGKTTLATQGDFKVQEDKKHRDKFQSLEDSEKKLQFFSARQIACRLLGSRGYLCQKCWLPKGDCMCSRIMPCPLWHRIHFWLYMHPKDFLRQNNTGKLLWQVFGNHAATLCLFGISELEEIMWNTYKFAGRRNVCCLYPNKIAVPKSVHTFIQDSSSCPESGKGWVNGDETLNFILIDGTWSNSQALFNRLQDRAQVVWGEDLPCVSLNSGVSLMHKLRPQPSWDRTCTAAAAVGLLYELELIPEFSSHGLRDQAGAIEYALEILLEALTARRIRMGRSIRRKERHRSSFC